MQRDAAVEAYLEDARRWEDDRIAQSDRARRQAYWVAAAMSMIAALALLALVAITPLKSVEPWVIRVDSSTGIADVVPVYAGEGELPELVTRHLLHHYVVARERYFYALAEQDYNTVGAFNSSQLNAEWLAAWDRNNPESPLVRYKDGTTVRAQVKAVSFITRASGERDLAQVRFLTATRPGGSGAERIAHYIATLQYAYGKPSKDDATRVLNPLGFRVLDYRREPEIVVEPPAAAKAEAGLR
jgi:type IV secretion system protein VirB8